MMDRKKNFLEVETKNKKDYKLTTLKTSSTLRSTMFCIVNTKNKTFTTTQNLLAVGVNSDHYDVK